jgi:metal-responsive CopG/Arc/MetJ family transcriptional regulator
MKTIAITIEEDLLNRIDRLTAQLPPKANRSKVIRAAVSEYLTRVERIAEEEREKEIFRKNRKLLARQADALVKEQAKP